MTAATRSRYVYKPEDSAGVPRTAGELGRQVGANRYLKRILYGNDTPYLPADGAGLPVPVVLPGRASTTASTTWPTRTPAESAAWPCRPDPFSTYRPGFEVRTYRTCRRHPDVPPVCRSSAMTPCWYAPPTSRTAQQRASADPALPPLQPARLGHADRLGAPAGGAAMTPPQLPPLQLGYSAAGHRRHPAGTRPAEPGELHRRVRRTRRALGRSRRRGPAGNPHRRRRAWYYQHNVSAWNPAAARRPRASSRSPWSPPSRPRRRRTRP